MLNNNYVIIIIIICQAGCDFGWLVLWYAWPFMGAKGRRVAPMALPVANFEGGRS